MAKKELNKYKTYEVTMVTLDEGKKQKTIEALYYSLCQMDHGSILEFYREDEECVASFNHWSSVERVK